MICTKLLFYTRGFGQQSPEGGFGSPSQGFGQQSGGTPSFGGGGG